MKFNNMITVGIPTYNEEKVIVNAINSVLPQISKKDEVLVVASGCTDNTIPNIKSLMKREKRIRLIIERERKGKASAINLIIKNSRGDIIVQTDGDVVLSKNAIKLLLKHFKDLNIGAVSGNPIPIIPKENLFYEWTIMSYKKAGELREKQSRQGNFWHLSGYLLAFRKEALREVPFAKGAVDAWMGKVIGERGYAMTYEPKAEVFVKAPLNIRDFINQKARVRAGYIILKSQSGKVPRSIKGEILWFPTELFKVPIIHWHKFILSGLIYLYSWIKGFYMAKTNKSLQEIWKVPNSTK